MSAVKHNPDALTLAIARGLRDCTQDSTAQPLAAVIRAVVLNSHSASTDEGDALDAVIISSIVDPMLAKCAEPVREKLAIDMVVLGEFFTLLGEAVAEFNARGHTQ